MTEDLDLAVRVARALATAAKAEEACTMSHLADYAGDDEVMQMWGEHAGRILNEMSTVDLGLVIVAGFNDRARQEAWRLWSQLNTLTPKDVR